ncbi:MAG: peptidoglycan-binding protein [Clostridiales bacterium]|nr:peptidoglycan-binding protein [Clostridiales bacterium]
MKRRILRVLALTLTVMLLLASTGLAETIKLYDKGNNVLALQTALSDLKYYTGKLDGKFGTGTLKAVKAFQKAEGLKVDGLAGKATQARLVELTGVEFEQEEVEIPDTPSKPKTLFAGDYRTMQFGTAGPRVRVLQRCLLALGFDVTVDGDFGSSTHKAVKAFQAIVGYTQDGKAGERTLTKLESYFDADGNCISGPIAGNKPATPEPDPDAPVYGIPERTLRMGDTGLDVKYVMKRLYDLKYYNKAADEKFGAGMLSAVKAFQKKNGLTQDGVVGPATIKVLFSADALSADALTPLPDPDPLKLPLKRGDKGAEVKEVQTALKNLGYAVGKVDGSYGAKTQAAVKLFQARNGMTVDGKVGQRTLDRLFSPDAVPANGKAPELPEVEVPSTDTGSGSAPEVIVPGDG